MEIIAGIDEAGRGPVLGPMVIVGVEASEHSLKKFRLKDSKEYARVTRDNLAISLIRTVERIHIRVLYPEIIDYFVKNKTINELEFLAYLSIIKDVNAETIYVDCFSTNIDYIKRLFKERVPQKRFIVEHKADRKYPIVSAAAIIAKHIRDAIMDVLSKDLGVYMGSGYPSDPRTINFLKSVLEEGNVKILNGIVRFSWKTVKRLTPKAKKTLLDL